MLLHGDIRADNMFFDGDRLKVVDFQFTCGGPAPTTSPIWSARACPSTSGAAMTRSWFGATWNSWGRRLFVRRGLRHYRLAVAYLIVLPVITLIGWDALPERSRALCLTLTDRAVAAIDEIDALEEFWMTRTAREVVELYNLVVWNTGTSRSPRN
jgi:aminoglycoside phosphotransferase (APT) family kinase protein